jgi:hypothetical protein
MKKIIVIDDIFDGVDDITSNEFNSLLIDKISNHQGWHLSRDEKEQSKKVESNFSDSGMLLQSFYNNQSEYLNSHNSDINYMASIILDRILSISDVKFTNVSTVRFLWNYYNRSSTGVKHKDIGDNIEGNYCSIVYYLNTCDGYTKVEDEYYNSTSGKCVIFNSKLNHYGRGPIEDSKRFVLNIIFKYDEII